MPFTEPWLYLEIIIPSEKSQTEKDKYHTKKITYMWNLKKKYTNELNYKIETYSDLENNLRLLKEKGGGK